MICYRQSRNILLNRTYTDGFLLSGGFSYFLWQGHSEVSIGIFLLVKPIFNSKEFQDTKSIRNGIRTQEGRSL